MFSVQHTRSGASEIFPFLNFPVTGKI
jgi:hypothetical protein